ncbi:WD40 repeat-like protein [Rhizopogon vinicolor AM-OR11-026]|uniref:WD40 repeat-like protein n=1 Tax=Rhizopogon vinicolor AM-OR11-026 TaxID=1314800 RepID=A0A1B7MLY7_9AGAM|nr:WD40 repeat-like protein [Rhizopogon vinicolor AM-OR11-026]
MASTSTRTAPAAKETILTPVITLKGHEDYIRSISYLPDGKQMISGSDDRTARRWDLEAGKEIEKARKVCEYEVRAVAVSRDSRWVVTAGGKQHDGPGELKAWEVDTGIVTTFHGHSKDIICMDISADSMLLASGSEDQTQIWSLDTGKLVAGLFENAYVVGAIRFSPDSKKLLVNSKGRCRLGVYDIQTQKWDRRVKGAGGGGTVTYAPVLWTNKGTRILAVFNFSDSDDSSSSTFYEFDASTLETVGAPFKGHTDNINGLAHSSDGALIASTSFDNTIRLWAFESRQLLTSFHVSNPNIVVFSTDVQQLACTTYDHDDNNIYICNVPPNILASIGLATKGHPKTGATLQDLLDPDAPSRPRRRHNSATPRFISCAPNQPIPLPTRDPQQHIFLRHLRKFLRSSSPTEVVPPVLNEHLRDPLDIPATSRLHPIHSPSEATTQGHSRVGPRENHPPLYHLPELLSH